MTVAEPTADTGVDVDGLVLGALHDVEIGVLVDLHRRRAQKTDPLPWRPVGRVDHGGPKKGPKNGGKDMLSILLRWGERLSTALEIQKIFRNTKRGTFVS